MNVFKIQRGNAASNSSACTARPAEVHGIRIVVAVVLKLIITNSAGPLSQARTAFIRVCVEPTPIFVWLCQDDVCLVDIVWASGSAVRAVRPAQIYY